MSRLNVFMFPISPDYSGAAAALFDLGGITVMHDASGCTGNYTGYDEPRWLGSRSATYCSGLRRMDAILGNDEKYIRRTIRAAKDLKPSIICLLGSPVPILIGTDLKGMAREIEAETGVPSFGFETSGQGYYDRGASDVFLALTRRFCSPAPLPGAKQTSSPAPSSLKVNLLGMLPLDFGNRGNLREIPAFLQKQGMEIIANYAFGLSVDQIRRASEADWNLVMSRSGYALARYMEKQYGIPWFCGVPTGDGRAWLEAFQAKRASVSRANAAPETPPVAAASSRSSSAGSAGQQPDTMRTSAGHFQKEVLIIHEQVFANSLREILRDMVSGLTVRVGSLIGLESSLAEAGDLDLNLEATLIQELNSGRYSAVIGDPELKRVLRNKDTQLIGLPHAAVSSKLHWDEYPSYLGEELPQLLQSAAACATL